MKADGMSFENNTAFQDCKQIFLSGVVTWVRQIGQRFEGCLSA